MRSCEFNYCVYNEENECVLEEISVSPLGMCEECLIPDIDEAVLAEAKGRLLAKLQSKSTK